MRKLELIEIERSDKTVHFSIGKQTHNGYSFSPNEHQNYFLASNGIHLCSKGGPFVNGNTLFVKGSEWEFDKTRLCAPIEQYQLFVDAVAEYNEKARGLYIKYTVTRNDGSPKHRDCEYFVLDLNHDEFAIAALKKYRKKCKDKYPALAADLKEKIKQYKALS